MKKSIFLIITILSLFIFTDNVYASSFTVNGKEVEVNEDNLIYYCYFLHPNIINYDNIIVYYGKLSTYFCFAFNSSSEGYTLEQYNSTTSYTVYGTSPGAMYEFSNTFVPGSAWDTYNFSEHSIAINKLLHTTFNIYKKTHSTTLSASSNITKQDIIDYFNIKNKYTITYYVNNEVYKTFEVEEGTSHELINYDHNKNTHNFSGWNIETENVDLKNITSNITIKATLEEKEVLPVYIEFPINKTEFYALLVEVGVLIMIIFLKWCFPFKMGSDLK